MNMLSRMRPTILRRRRELSLLAALLLAGCQREEIRVYTAPKDKPAPAHPMTLRTPPIARPEMSWKLPPGWRETGPGKMSVATFTIAGAGGEEAQVTITPLPNMAGRETMIVNMWREQVGLQPLSEDEANKQFQTVELAGERGSLFELSGAGQESKGMRIVTAMLHRSDSSWFFKLAGDDALVATQKPAFVEFLKSIQFKQVSASETSATGETPKPNWQVPAQWKQLPAGQMQVAKFAVPERASAKAEVSVSVFPNDTGGKLANVNRWRKQIGLGEVSDADLASLAAALDPANSDAMLVDMTNNNKRLVGAIVPRSGSYWFYKLLGDAEAVAPEKEAFVAFAKSKP